jgi:hypothetical protein
MAWLLNSVVKEKLTVDSQQFTVSNEKRPRAIAAFLLLDKTAYIRLHASRSHLSTGVCKTVASRIWFGPGIHFEFGVEAHLCADGMSGRD